MRGEVGDGEVRPGPTSPGEAIWASVEAARRWLDAANGTSTAEMSLRLLKIVEEAGEGGRGLGGRHRPEPTVD